MAKETIKLDMAEYNLRKSCGKSPLTQQEKIARLYKLADKLHVKIGGSK